MKNANETWRAKCECMWVNSAREAESVNARVGELQKKVLEVEF